MSNTSPACSVVSLSDVELVAQIRCARRRLIAIAPGFTETVAKVICQQWRELGCDAVQIVVDPDPEVCRLGLGDLEALKLLHQTAAEFGVSLQQQKGLRVGVVITDETITAYAPVARLIETSGKQGERRNALRLDSSIAHSALTEDFGLNLRSINSADVQRASQNLSDNPPVKFDLERKIRVFNSRFEFVEFELHGLFLSRNRVQIPSDLLGLARDPKTQKLLRSSFQLIDDNSEISSDHITNLKQSITKAFLINLPNYGTVILRTNKETFQKAVTWLEYSIADFKNRVENELDAEIDRNREALIYAILPTVLESPPDRWMKYIGSAPDRSQVESVLRTELGEAFGNAGKCFSEMRIKVLFKGVTHELLNNPEFMKIASEELPLLNNLYEEYAAARADELGEPIERSSERT